MTSVTAPPGGTFQLGDLTVSRVGFGAMQLAGPGVFGPPADRAAAVAVLREALALGVTHIDTADYYGPYVTNEIIREALYPYPDGLHIVTKVGARRDDQGGWPHARTPAELREQVHDNLRRLGLEALDVVNLRVGGQRGARARVDRRAVRRAGRAAQAGTDQAPRPVHASTRTSWRRRRRSRRSCACRTSTTWPSAATTRWSS